MKIASKLIDFKEMDLSYSVVTDGVEIRIVFLTENIVRIRAGFDQHFKERSYSLVMTAWEDDLDNYLHESRKRIIPRKVQVTVKEEKIELKGSELKLVVIKEPFNIQIYDKNDHCLHADIVDLGYLSDRNNRRIHTAEIMDGDCFYGFGEKTGPLNKARKFMSMSPKDAMGYDPKETDSLYKHIPFYLKCNRLTKRAVGYFYHTTYECDFDMGRSHSNYWNKHSRFRVDGGDIDLFFIAGPAIKDVIQRYTGLTGKSCLLPIYALGYLGSSMYYSELDQDCDEAIIEFVETAKAETIPIDGFQLSSGYTAKNGKRYIFTWNKERFKDPKHFFTVMKEKGVTVSPNVKPGLLLNHPLRQEMEQDGLLVKESQSEHPCVGTWWGGEGVFADFTNPQTRKRWKNYLHDHLFAYGVDSIWNDNCEYDSIVDQDARCHFEGLGGTIGQLKSVMANLMCQVTEAALSEHDASLRSFIVCRSGHAGIQRYAQSWAGDNYTSWETLKYNIATILGMGLCGVTNYGCDIGGFYGPAPEGELFVRWVQNGIFQPRFSIHSTNIDNTVTEPWMYTSYKNLIKEALEFRYRLIPYFYSLMRRAHETGLPILQPLVMAFQSDENCYEESVDFMLGDYLLVANVVEKGQKTREIYLPKNEVFYDFVTRKRYEGGQKILVSVDLDSIPLFIRAGAIIPLAGNQLLNLHQDQVRALHLLIAPDKDCEWELYEDDGKTNTYKEGMFLKSCIQVKAGERVVVEVSRKGNYPTSVETVLIDMIHPNSAPFWVTLEGTKLKCFQNRQRFERESLGWYYSQSKKSVLIKYPNPQADYLLEVSFEAFDLLGM